MLKRIIETIKNIYGFVGGQFKKRQKRYKLIPMRELSETEKQVIISLVKWEYTLKEQPHNYNQIFISHLFRDLCKKYDSKFEIDFENKEIILKSTSKTNLTALAENNSFRRDFISLVYFIDYLKNERLIYLVAVDPESSQQPFTMGGELIPNKEAFVSRIDDVEFIELLNLIFKKYIYPTEYLSKYYENDCKTDEEVRFNINIGKTNESIKIANESLVLSNKAIIQNKYTLFAAIFFGFISIGLQFIDFNKPKNNTSILLDRIDIFEEKTEKRFFELENRINIRLDSIDSRLKRVENEIFVIKPWENYYQRTTPDEE